MSGVQGKYFPKDIYQEIVHRGPDSSNQISSPNLVAFHSRLKIVDLSSEADQPFSDGKRTLLFNGEIYNFHEFEKDLQRTFKSDSLMLYHFLQNFDTSRLDELNGMFSFSYICEDLNTLFLVRDFFGQKPLFYGWATNGDFLFGTSARLIAEHLGSSIIHEHLDIYQMFQFQIPGTTMYRDVFEIPAGHVGEFRNNILTLKVYKKIDIKYLPLDMENLYKVFENSIEVALISDVPIAATLSGGIDSSTINFFMSKNLQFHTAYHGSFFGGGGRRYPHIANSNTPIMLQNSSN